MKSLKVQGKANYFLQPILKGDPPYQSTSLILQAFTNDSRKVPLDLNYRYFRIKNKVISSFSAPSTPNIYHFSIDDIGSIVKIEISPLENRVYNGTLEVLYGPIELDPSLKYTMENILTSGCSKFRVKSKNNEDFTLFITQDSLKFEKDNGISCQFKYFLDKPRIEVHPEENVNFLMKFDKDCENYPQIQDFFLNKAETFSMSFIANSRNSKDLIIGVIKSFSVRSFLINSRTFDCLQTGNFIEELGFFLEIEKLKKEINGVLEINKGLQMEKGEITKEMMNLEDELKKTIENYSKVINEMKQTGNFTINESLLDVSMINRKEGLENMRKTKLLERENTILRENVKSLKGQIEVLENFNKNEAFFEDSRDFDNKDQKHIAIIIDLQRKYEESRKLNNVLLSEIAENKLETEENNEKNEKINDFSKKNKELIQEIEVLRKKAENVESFIRKIKEKDLEIEDLRKNVSEQMKELEKIRKNPEIEHLKLELEALKREKQRESLVFKEKPRENLAFSINSNEINALKHEIETLKSENEVFQRENLDLLDDRKRKMEKLLDLERENRVLKTKPDFSNKNNDFSNKNNDLSKDFINKEHENRLLRENQLLKQENAEKNNEIEDLRFKYNAFSSELKVMKAEKVNKCNEFEEILKENQRLKGKISEKSAFLIEKPRKFKENNDFKEENLDLIEKIENLENEKRALINKNESIMRELMKIQRNCNESGEVFSLRKRVIDLENEIQLMIKERNNIYNKAPQKTGNRGIFS